MSGLLAQIWRHPIKAHGREEITHVKLSEGRSLPWDRRWAVAHEMAKLDFDRPGWAPCANFSRGSKAPALQAITARCDMSFQTVTLSHPKLKDLTISPDADGAGGELVQWIMPLVPKDRALPSRIARAPGRGMTDTDYPSISLINLSSHRAVEGQLGRRISPLRWRANLIVDGLGPWEELEWVGKRIRVGAADLEVVEPITRCLATAASTRSGQRDTDTLGALNEGWGHQLMGVYARVATTGDIRQGDPVGPVP